jgi:hypothetical protein
MEYYRSVLQKFFNDLAELKSNTPEIKLIHAQTLSLAISALGQLKDKVNEVGFKTEANEIEFFKEIKPKIYAELIVSTKIIEFQAKKLTLPLERLNRYRERIFREFNHLFQDNMQFVHYYTSKSNHLDHQYFMRSHEQLPTLNSTQVFLNDNGFSTAKGNLLAHIIAFEQLENHFYEKENSSEVIKSKLVWTESKLALVELIYALHDTKALNDGNADIKEIAEAFELFFDVDLVNVYRSFREIGLRKQNRSKFIDELNANINKRLDDSDNIK